MDSEPNITLIVCTYMRPEALKCLLNSVQEQTRVPEETIIVDGSTNSDTRDMLDTESYPNLSYYLAPPEHRGLTRQRNYGVARVNEKTDFVCFLDDDTILEKDYFQQILKTYTLYPEALGVGGFITNEVKWQKSNDTFESNSNYYCYDGYCRKESSRWKLRKKLGLYEDLPPAIYPKSGHGRSISSLPPSDKIYKVEQLMGGVSSFPLHVLKKHKFSEYFDGYGLYEDADFTLRLSHLGSLYVNTAAQLEHHHDAAGRPNKYSYGKMVVRNGWYVWKIKHPKVSFRYALKWYAISILQIAMRATNVIKSSERKEAFTETLGRIVGLISLFFNAPRVQHS